MEVLLEEVQSPNEVAKLESQVEDIGELRVEVGVDHLGEVLERVDLGRKVSVLHW